MPAGSNREAHFPAIEKKHGKPMSHWHRVMKSVSDRKYAEQIAFLREEHGFSQVHANALVMYSRGSTTSRRFSTPTDYFKSLEKGKAETVKSIFAAIMKKHPDLELVMAWNQPMLKRGKDYVIGVSVASNHLLIAPWGNGVIARFADRLSAYETNKKTFKVPVGWKVDEHLLNDLVMFRLGDL